MNVNPKEECGAVSSGLLLRVSQGRQTSPILMDNGGWERLFYFSFLFFYCAFLRPRTKVLSNASSLLFSLQICLALETFDCGIAFVLSAETSTS